MLAKLEQVEAGRAEFALVSVQLSFSTADIQQSIFFDEQSAQQVPSDAEASDAPQFFLVVNGEYVALDDADLPDRYVAITEESGLFNISGDQTVSP